MKIRYALLALVAAVLNGVGNAVVVLNSEVKKVSLVISTAGTSFGLSKWFLLLFAACALGVTFAYVLLRIKRARKEEVGANEKLEDRAVLIASIAVAAMGWILTLVLL